MAGQPGTGRGRRHRLAPGEQEPRSVGATLSTSFANIRGVFLVLLLVETLVVTVILLWFHPRLDKASSAYTLAAGAHATMLDQQTELFSYLLTTDSDPSYLDQANADHAALDADTNSLVHLSFRPASHAALEQTLTAAKAWQATFANPIESGAGATRPTVEVTGPCGTAASGSGGGLTSGARARLADCSASLFVPYENANAILLDDLSADQVAAVTDERDALIGSLALGVLLFLGMAFASARESRRLAHEITEPVGELVDTIEQIGAGDLEARAETSGPTEIMAVEKALRDMAASLAQEQARRVEREREIAAYADDLQEILQSAQNMSATLALDVVLQAVTKATTAVTGIEDVTVWLSEARGLVAEGHPTQRNVKRRVARAAASLIPVGFDAGDDAGLAVPMISGGRLVGVIDMIGPEAGACGADVTGRHQQLLDILAAHAGTAIETARLHAETERLSVTDELTQLPNRRRLSTDLAFEVERAQRFGRPLAVVMVDVDDFKDYNDTHGHLEGDRVLAAVAAVLAGGVREVDSVYRYGGEEFLALVREAGATEAQSLAERLREEMRAGTSGADGAPGVTASFGVAALVDGDDPASLVDAADAALYRAKADGRDRVVVGERALTSVTSAAGGPGGHDRHP